MITANPIRKSHGTALKAALSAALILTAATSARAHFLWLVAEPARNPTQAHLYFAERAEADDPDLLDRVRNPQIVLLDRKGRVTKLKSGKAKESIVAKLPGTVAKPSALLLSHQYGVISRGKSTFLLMYYAKHYIGGPRHWRRLNTSKQLALDISPAWSKGRLQLRVTWKQKPVAKAQVKIEGPGIEDSIEGETNAKGTFSTQVTKPGLFSIRVRHIEKKLGKSGDKTIPPGTTRRSRCEFPEQPPLRNRQRRSPRASIPISLSRSPASAGRSWETISTPTAGTWAAPTLIRSRANPTCYGG